MSRATPTNCATFGFDFELRAAAYGAAVAGGSLARSAGEGRSKDKRELIEAELMTIAVFGLPPARDGVP
jgi:hypothetical protein